MGTIQKLDVITDLPMIKIINIVEYLHIYDNIIIIYLDISRKYRIYYDKLR